MAVKETAENCRKSKRPFSVAGVLAYLGVSPNEYEEQYQNKKSVAWRKKAA